MCNDVIPGVFETFISQAAFITELTVELLYVIKVIISFIVYKH